MFTFYFVKSSEHQSSNETHVPFIVSIRDFMRYTDHVASGSILNSRFILTNARPFAKQYALPSHFKIVGNISKTWEDSTDYYSVERMFIHPNYNEVTHENDIALLQTTKAINFHDGVQPISLSESVLTEQDAIMSGFGFTEAFRTIRTPLINVAFRAISSDECKRILSSDDAALVFESKACVLPIDGRKICNNDNGAPLTTNNQVIAFSSWHVPCVQSSPIVVERVSAHLDFIKEVMNTTA